MNRIVCSITCVHSLLERELRCWRPHWTPVTAFGQAPAAPATDDKDVYDYEQCPLVPPAPSRVIRACRAATEPN